MNLSVEVFLILAAVLLYLDILFICSLLIKTLQNNKEKKISQQHKNIFLNTILGKVTDFKKKLPIVNYFKMKQSIQLDKSRREMLEKLVDIDKAEKKYLKGLTSFSKAARIEAAVHLGLLGTENARMALEKSIVEERDYPARLYMANALVDIGNEKSIPVLVTSLINAQRWYRDKVNMLISDFGDSFNSYLPLILASDKIEIKELIVDFSSVYFSEHIS